MNKKPGTSKDAADKLLKSIRRKTRRTYSAEKKIRIVLAGLRGKERIFTICRREGISDSLYYTWSKEFLESGKRRLSGDTARQATSHEVKDLRSEAMALKECMADLTLENCLLKKHDRGWGVRRMKYTATEKLEIIRTVEGRICQPRRPLICWASRAPHFTGSIIDKSKVALMPSRMARLGQSRSGTVFRRIGRMI